MDVNLPDGRILRNVPDGTTQDQILAKLRAAGEDVSWAAQKQTSGPEALAKETGIGEALMVGAGHKTDRILNGLTQMYLGARGEKKALAGLAANVQSGEDAYAPLARQRPVATALGEALPALAVPGAGGSYAGAAAAGAAPELLSYGDAWDRTKRGGVGATGGIVGRWFGGLLNAGLKPAGVGTSANKEAMAAAERIGYKPLAGEATGNRALMNVENYLSRSPGSSGAMQRLAQDNTQAVNTAAARSIGQRANEVGPGVLGAAESQIGQEFTRLQGVTAPQLGDDFVNALATIEQKNATLGPFRDKTIDSILDKGMDLAAKGNLSGSAYKQIRTELSNQSYKAYKAGDATLGSAVKDVRIALDQAAESSLGPADREAWKLAREQWGNWKTLSKGFVSEAGNVSPARVAQQLRSQGPAFRTGRSTGDLPDIARIGEGFKTAQNPNSGNLAATVWGSAITPANFAAQKIYTHPLVQKYLRDGILDIGPTGELIVKATGIPLGIAGTNEILGAQR